MAKKRTVTRPAQTSAEVPVDSASTLSFSELPMMIAAAITGGAIVYVSYHPSDSVAVENGDALWFGVIAILLGTVTWAASLLGGQSQQGRPSLLIDLVAWGLAAWMMWAAFATAPPGNLRFATNEAWLWVSGAAVFTSARRLFQHRGTQRACLALVIVCATALAVHGLHQQFISLPADRQAYRDDPDAVLRQAGLHAPEGSAERMVFESRLFDGGPTGTFALANSLAGVLLVGMIASLGVMRFSWARAPWRARAVGSAAIVLCLVCLFAVRSRSALLAAVMGVVLLFAWSMRGGENRSGFSASGWLWKAGAVMFAILIALMFALAAVADAEWIEQAPASLAFRLQYWRSTLAMTLDRPVYSAGPGNFQSIYLQYREDSASEQIAEPHNFLFETMASGGFPALLILFALLALLAWIWLGRVKAETTDSAAIAPADTDVASANWVGFGALVALVLVWLIGFAAGRTPDFRAHCIALPVSIAIGFAIWQGVHQLHQPKLNLICATSLFSLMVHLLASGGWTIPGVAVFVWLLAAQTSRWITVEVDAPNGGRLWAITGVLAAGVLMLAALRSLSLVPVQTATLAIAEAEYAQRGGHVRQAQVALDRAIGADPWSAAAVIWQADLLHWGLVREGDSTNRRADWHQQVQRGLERAGQSPSAWEAIGHQQLHVYQRFGAAEDLAAADATFAQVTEWNPADQSAVSQLAAIAEARGDVARAKKLADRAFYLSQLGNNIERDLARQLIYVPKLQGLSAAGGPITVPASELLSNQLR